MFHQLPPINQWSPFPRVFSAGFEKVNEKVQELMIAWVATMVKAAMGPTNGMAGNGMLAGHLGGFPGGL